MPEISAIIVTWNTRQMTLDCLRTLTAALDGIESEVIVVDNASNDETAAAIPREFPQVQVIANSENRGFGAANNQGMAVARGRHLLLLNSDAFPKKDAIRTLVNELDAQPRAALIGPRLLNGDGTLQLSCFKFPSPGRAWAENLWLASLFPNSALGDYRRWSHDVPRNVDWLIGACMLVRREMYEQVGGFDERFFMYAEESDWQLRMRKAGWQIAFTPRAEVTHLAGASSEKSADPADKVRVNPVFFDSLDYYERKHHGLIGLAALRAAMVCGCSMRLCLWLAASVISRRRKLALRKVRLHTWLVWRQLTTLPPKIVVSPAKPVHREGPATPVPAATSR